MFTPVILHFTSSIGQFMCQGVCVCVCVCVCAGPESSAQAD